MSRARTYRRARPVSAVVYENDSAWHLDKRVPIALIVTLMLQAAGAIWWASTVSGEIKGLRNDVDAIKVDARERNTKIDQIGTIQAKVEGMADTMQRIDRALERVQEKLSVTPRR